MRGDDQVAITRVDQDVVNADARQTRHKALPGLAAIERDVEAELGPDEEQVGVFEVFPQSVDIALLRQIAGDVGPGFAEVRGLEKIRRPVVQAVRIQRDVGRAGVEVRGFNAGNLHVTLRSALDVRVDVGERFPRILADLQIPVVRPDPDDAGFGRRLADLRGERVGGIAIVLFRHGLIAGDVHDGQFRRPAIDVLREIFRIHPPRVAAVAGLEEILRGHIDDGRVVGRNLKRGVPVKAQRIKLRRGVYNVGRSATATTSAGGGSGRSCGTGSCRCGSTGSRRRRDSG